MTKQVSVIIPCHNCAQTLPRALQSVLGQSNVLEIILVNNHSTDDTVKLINYYKKKYPDLIFAYDEQKRGAPAARNAGLSRSKGDWIQFLDADDELLPEKILRQMEIAQFINADVIAGAAELKYGNTYSKVRRVDQHIWRGLITSRLGITSSNLWRRSVLITAGGWDEGLTSSQEYDLLFRLLKKNVKIVADNEINTIVYFSADSVSKSTNTQRKREILKNRIDLRLRIKNTLNARMQLTTKLNRAIDTYIYTEIMDHYELFPAYAERLLKDYKPNVQLQYKLQLKAKFFLKKVKTFTKTTKALQ